MSDHRADIEDIIESLRAERDAAIAERDAVLKHQNEHQCGLHALGEALARAEKAERERDEAVRRATLDKIADFQDEQIKRDGLRARADRAEAEVAKLRGLLKDFALQPTLMGRFGCRICNMGADRYEDISHAPTCALSALGKGEDEGGT